MNLGSDQLYEAPMVRLRMKSRIPAKILTSAWVTNATHSIVPGISSRFHFPSSFSIMARAFGMYQNAHKEVGMLVVSGRTSW